jgi:hypothetical protein
MKSVFYYIILLSFPLFSFGQNNFLNSAQSLGIANCYTTQKGIWSTTTNPAGGANSKDISIGIGIKNNFGLSELNNKTAVGLIPTKSGVFGFSVQQYGFNQYNENKFGLSFAKQLSETFNSGIKIDYYSTHIQNYENAGLVTFEIGIQKELSRKLILGSFIHNPLNISKNINTPSVIAIGLQYNVNPKVNLYTEAENTDYDDLTLKVGVEYQIINHMFLRTGYNSVSQKNTFGFSYNYKNYVVDIATYHHQILGFSSQFSLSTSF